MNRAGHAEAGGIRLYYEEHGSGPPLLMVAGLGCATWMWWRTIPGLRQHFRLISFDNRGVGRSDKPDLEYTIEAMAEDAIGLLDALKIDRAHVLGISMGGYIAQAMARAWPDRVLTLTLGCTALRGTEATPEFQAAVSAASHLPPEPFLRRILPLVVAPGYWESHPHEFELVLHARLAALPPAYAYRHQAAACLRFDSGPWARDLNVPALVVAGEQDRVLPPSSAGALASSIPGARLHLLPGAGHYSFAEQADQFHALVLAHCGVT